MIEALIRLMGKPKEFSGPINLGNPKEFTILELAKLVIKATKSNSIIHFKDLPFDDPLQRQPDISLAKKEILWEPKIQIKEGLEKTVNYFKKIR